MVRQNGRQRLMVLLLLIGPTSVTAPALAQQPATAPSDPQRKNTKEGKEDKHNDKPGETVGKSKLEQETGTVNDRIFAVLPNYGTVETANALKPLRTGQKFRIATASVFDWAAYPFNGVLAGIAQAKNEPESYGQ